MCIIHCWHEIKREEEEVVIKNHGEFGNETVKMTYITSKCCKCPKTKVNEDDPRDYGGYY